MSRRNAAWTVPELKRLRVLFPVLSHGELALAFPRHPYASIRCTASAHGLGKLRRCEIMALAFVPSFRFGASA